MTTTHTHNTTTLMMYDVSCDRETNMSEQDKINAFAKNTVTVTMTREEHEAYKSFKAARDKAKAKAQATRDLLAYLKDHKDDATLKLTDAQRKLLD